MILAKSDEEDEKYWQYICLNLPRIKLKKLEQIAWLITSIYAGTHPLTGLPVNINLEGNQVMSFYAEKDETFWVSPNSGREWIMLPHKEDFDKILRKIDVMI